ncbi:MAG: hexitol phosphatase HxpB [Bacteroidota bacterium]
MIKGVIFDLDGLLIDSEPLWKEAEMKAFKEVGIELNLDMCAQTTGLDTNDVVKHWYAYKPWDNLSFEEVKHNIEGNIIDLILEKGNKKPGVDYIVNFFLDKNLPLAVASSSNTEIIETVLKKFEMRHHFQVVHSSEHEALGKPNPAVYITTCQKLGINPTETLAFEDSFYGLLAAKSARLKAVVVPDDGEFDNPKFIIAEAKLNSLKDFDEALWRKLGDE